LNLASNSLVVASVVFEVGRTLNETSGVTFPLYSLRILAGLPVETHGGSSETQIEIHPCSSDVQGDVLTGLARY